LFTVGALAIAARRANAVGAVRLTCAPEGLDLELVRVASFTEGFAAASVAEVSSYRVPYTAVRGLVRTGRTLFLALDPAVATPYSRFALARFTLDPGDALARAYRARARARWASYVVPGPLGALTALFAPGALASGVVGRGSLGLLVAIVGWLLLRELVAWLTWGGPISDRYRDAFEAEMSRKLGLAPALLEAHALASPPEAHEPAEAARGFLRPVAAVAGAAAFAVVVMALIERPPAPPRPPPHPVELTSRLAPIALGLRADLPLPPPGPARCTCARAASPLWRGGLPKLEVLMFSSPDDGLAEVAPSGDPPRYDFDVVAINDASRPLRDVRITFTFARRTKRGRRAGATDRGLFWGGELAPGHSVRWHVKAPGTEMRFDTSVPESLEDDGPAPAEGFYDLATGSRYRAVRLHALSMLAYLRDGRAEGLLHALDAGRPGERTLRDRLARATAPVIACELEAQEDFLEACVFNGSSRPASNLVLAEAMEGAGGTAAADPAAAPSPARSWPIEGTVPVHDGVRVRLPLEGGGVPDDVGVVSAPAEAEGSSPSPAR
jgi:hypothetical protein